MASTASAPTSLNDLLAQYFDKGAAAVKAGTYVGSFDIPKLHQKTQSALSELGWAIEDGTPQLLIVPESAKVTFVSLLEALNTASVTASTKPEHRQSSTVDPERTLTSATATAEGVRRRLLIAINGKDANSEEATRLRKAILADRGVPQSRSGWDAELQTIIAAIKQPSVGASVAVRGMLEKLEAAKVAVESSVPQVGRTPNPVWLAGALTPAAALDLALSDLLSWAAAKATDARLARFQAAIMPRRRGDDAKDGDVEPTPVEDPKPEPVA